MASANKVATAVKILAKFCEKYGTEIDLRDIVGFSIAWYDGKHFDCKTKEGEIGRIVTVVSPTHIAEVYSRNNPKKLNEQLTKELNDAIFKETGRWFS
jgi:acetylornithine deacetylase/succinyl-diaminopimelate desuccinylase-like protein